MLNLIFNLTSEPNTRYISLIYQTLGFTFTNVSLTYAICGSIIVMCMFATTLRNLIYKVLNLAVLSVFVVALWAYLTDVTFIYVVYILTFVSAVVMLFLSVVLMLPSSAIAVTKRNSIPWLFALGTSENTSTYNALIHLAYFSSSLMIMLFFIYLLKGAFTKNRMPPSAAKKRGTFAIRRDLFADSSTKFSNGEPLKYGISLPRFLRAAIKRKVNRLITAIKRKVNRLIIKIALVLIDICDYILDFPHLYNLGPHLLRRLAMDPAFKGRYVFVCIVRNFTYYLDKFTRFPPEDLSPEHLRLY
jgi:NADH:ubiquinone oxidoreductase subunit 6 (subunit J)